MKDTPINFEIVKEKINQSKIENVGRASIREIKKLIDDIEKETGEKFVRMEMGIPGLPASEKGVEAEINALRKGVANTYPDIQGIPQFKDEVSRFVKFFLDVDVDPEGCIPTVGSMQGSFAAFITTSRMYEKQDRILFLDPGFPVHKQQLQVLGQKWETFDVYNYRGEKLRDKLESFLSKENICALLYSNPNNPSWICFTEKELKIIAELADKYNVVVLEDLAYIAMDFRKELYHPGKPPYQATAARYTDNYILFISSSKAFSYAGQRIGMMAVSNNLFEKKCPDLKRYYNTDLFGRAMIFGTVYALSAGVTHSAQYAVAAMLKAANDGEFNFVEVVKEYGEKAKIMKKLFTENGFYIVYDKDENDPIADGFYFTFAYPGFSGDELLKEMLYYGISAITLAITGSERLEGIRACVSLIQRNQFPDLEYRLKKFNEHHSIKI
ncbi:MAG: pyridoxal phosphate-dependent aminotransferase [Ignavibacteria bacterium]|nr:pyridoxal phosphate-dependent aminotransferase [Ignavibacteria bacterium]MBT8382374.1 pyridoxal phosphate-dependent aminotransferase [Ignavibacteria bacterium]MBT8391840.1 pyridoxal phosphate-dependent aminotransferase [Ignavibacteria bacterium]NNJ51901.1 pyridoxal phosphate-dependent aminotransferase [Ignavibacteriaceae bacterium]NNL21109.1 pyridoxal phosphate-dependent aminotransferase [Ignavibacteriaceae bacterium]